MKLSEKGIDELAKALAEAQGQFSAAERAHEAKVVSKKGEGSSYKYNYADLAAYLDVCREPLAKNGLSFVQSVLVEDARARVTTLLLHASGQWIEFDPLTITASDLMPQSIGSAITYARRYSLSAATGMASEADDDGNAAQGNNAETARRDLPLCPKCNTNKSVIVGKPEFGGGFVCYTKKGGCGHKWQDTSAPPAEEPFGNPTVDDLKKQGKLTTADNLPIPKDPNDAFDLVGYFRKKIKIERDADALDAAVRELKNNKEGLGADYVPLLVEWFGQAIEHAADNERVRHLDAVLAKAKDAIGLGEVARLGAALDKKYAKEAVA